MAGRAVKYLEIWGRVDNATNADYAMAGAQLVGVLHDVIGSPQVHEVAELLASNTIVSK